MNQAALILATVLSFALPSQAAEAPAERAAAAFVPMLGALIAEQGNAALVQIREDMKRDLLERLRPYLPSGDERPADDRDAANAF